MGVTKNQLTNKRRLLAGHGSNMSQTALYIRAMAQRAEHEGERNVTLNIKDVLEILAYADSGTHKERVESKMKSAGWVNPKALRAVAVNKRPGTHIHRYRTPEHSMEVFFRGNLSAAEREQEALRVLRDEKNKANEARKEAANVQSSVS